jgi:uncharacterized protein YbjT (DUF2867 family)
VRILLTGCSGFIGSHLVPALRAQGHEVICAVRGGAHGESLRSIRVDFTQDVDAKTWIPRLAGVEAVINAVGILRESRAQTFEAIHVRSPQALFDACVAAGVRRVVQVSALGADQDASSRYHLSKRRADEHLAGLPLDWTIVQPSLVFGPGGTSARLFMGLASLPWIALPGDGNQIVQPIHIEDLVAGIVAVLESPGALRRRIAFVGPESMSLRTFLCELRRGMGLGNSRFVPIPLGWMRLVARLPIGGLLDSETLGMLMRGNFGDAAPLQELLRRRLREVRAFVPPSYASPLRMAAELQWLMPLLRWSIGLVWIATAVVSFGVYPVESSVTLLARVGVPAVAAPLLLYGAAVMDLIFGIGTLFLRKRRMLWLAQIAAIALYTLIITWRLPEFWLHPFGPILKNLPMLAGILLLYRLERR